MATKTQIRNGVLRRLGVIESGGTPSADEITDTEEEYDRLYAYLASPAINAVYWDSDEEVPDEAAYHFETLLISRICDDYISGDKVLLFQARASDSLSKLQELSAVQYVGQPIEANYF